MEMLIVAIFVIGYIAITIEHTLKIDKLIPALLMMAAAWTVIAFGVDGFSTWLDSHTNKPIEGFAQFAAEDKMHILEGTLMHHFGKTAEILIFLIGAMAIVEIIDSFNGFSTIKNFIKTNKKKTLLWIVCILGFVLSSIIDNLTATIVLITILRKLIPDNKDRIWYAGMIVIATNAGGAWSPIGDVTTTMLWMADKVSAVKLMEYLALPSVVCMVLPTFIASFMPAFRGEFSMPKDESKANPNGPLMLYFGLIMIVFVPVFKTITHLPPYLGMMLSLAVVSLVAEIASARQFKMTTRSSEGVADDHSHGGNSPTLKALAKIEMPSILFFLGILMTVAALESLGMVLALGQNVSAVMPENVFVIILGIASAVIDNVPLVAASIGMFTDPMDDSVWHFIAYAAGTGGSMLIIGSAAGVVAMGMEKISFFWYLKNITWLAAIGYFAGILVYLVFPH